MIRALKGLVGRSVGATALSGAVAAGALGVLPSAAMAAHHDGFDIGGFHVDIGIHPRHHEERVPPPLPPVYEERQVQVWVEPVYQTVADRQWVPATYRTVYDRVWVPDRYELRDYGRRDRDWRDRDDYRWRDRDRRDRGWRREERVLVEPGHFADVARQELVAEGHWETITRQVLVAPGHYETRVERVPVQPVPQP